MKILDEVLNYPKEPSSLLLLGGFSQWASFLGIVGLRWPKIVKTRPHSFANVA